MSNNPYQSTVSEVQPQACRKSLSLKKPALFFSFAVLVLVVEIIANQVLSRTDRHPFGQHGSTITNYFAGFISTFSALFGFYFSVRILRDKRRFLAAVFLVLNLLWIISILALVVVALVY